MKKARKRRSQRQAKADAHAKRITVRLRSEDAERLKRLSDALNLRGAQVLRRALRNLGTALDL